MEQIKRGAPTIRGDLSPGPVTEQSVIRPRSLLIARAFQGRKLPQFFQILICSLYLQCPPGLQMPPDTLMSHRLKMSQSSHYPQAPNASRTPSEHRLPGLPMSFRCTMFPSSGSPSASKVTNPLKAPMKEQQRRELEAACRVCKDVTLKHHAELAKRIHWKEHQIQGWFKYRWTRSIPRTPIRAWEVRDQRVPVWQEQMRRWVKSTLY